MNLLLLIPLFISIYLVARGRIETAFLNVYLPCLFLLQQAYAVRLPHFPETSAAEYALIPIGVVALMRHFRQAKFSLMDLFVLLYWAGFTVTEVLQEPVLNTGIFYSFNSFIDMVLAYVVGRQLIEPGLRFVTVRRIVVLVIFMIPFGLYEWRMAVSLYGIIGQKLLGLGSAVAEVQIRNGRGRLNAAFGDSEIAGIALGMTAALNSWLVFMNQKRMGDRLGTTLKRLEQFHVPGILLLGSLYLTQSRGPLGFAVLAYFVLQIQRFKNTKRAALLIGIALTVIGTVGYLRFQSAVNQIDPTSMNEQQQSTYYRVQMNDLYRPIAEQGGLWGWGMSNVPIIPGMRSIDNEFLRVWLVQGRLGQVLFILIVAETIRTLIARMLRFPLWEDRTFVVSLLAAMVVLFPTLLTVFMGEQLPQYAFLLIGWSQSVMGSRQMASVQTEAPAGKFAFRRVFG